MDKKKSVYFALPVILAAVVFAASCSSGPRPLRLDDGLIAFVGEDGNIHAADIWGADALVTTDAGTTETGLRTYAYPAWSPDGRELAFVRVDAKPDGSAESFLAAYDYTGRMLHSFFSSSGELPFYLYWSPDGGRIGFLSSEGQGMNFRIAGRDGGGRVAGTGSPIYWDWSPDGRSLVTHEGNPAGRGGSRLRAVSAADSGEAVDIPFTPAPFQAPAFSPDGRHVAAAGFGPDGRKALFLARRDGGPGLEALVPLIGAAVFDWSPRGGRIAYVDGLPTRMGTVGPLRVLDIGRRVFTVSHTPEPRNVAAFFWSPGGRRIAYFEPVFPDAAAGGGILFSLSVLDTDTNSTRHILTFRPTLSFLGQIVPFYGQYQKSASIWSPDGRNVVVSAVTEDGRDAVAAVSVDGEWEPWFVGYGTFPFWSRK